MSYRYAIEPLGVGLKPGARIIREGDPLEPGEMFTIPLEEWGEDKVLAQDQVSLMDKPDSMRHAELKEELIAKVQHTRDSMVAADGRLRVMFNNKWFSANERSQNHVAGHVQLLMVKIQLTGNPAETVTWHDVNAGRHEFTINELQALGFAMGAAAQAWWDAAGEGVREIAAAPNETETLAAYERILWPS